MRQVQLQLRNPFWILLIAQPETYGRGVAGTKINSRLILFVRDRGLKLHVRKCIEVVAYRLKAIRPHDHVDAAGAGLQARIEGCPQVGSVVEVDRRRTGEKAATAGQAMGAGDSKARKWNIGPRAGALPNGQSSKWP